MLKMANTTIVKNMEVKEGHFKSDHPYKNTWTTAALGVPFTFCKCKRKIQCRRIRKVLLHPSKEMCGLLGVRSLILGMYVLLFEYTPQ